MLLMVATGNTDMFPDSENPDCKIFYGESRQNQVYDEIRNCSSSKGC